MQKQFNWKFQVSEGFLLELGLCCTAIGQNKDSLKLQNFQFQENKFFFEPNEIEKIEKSVKNE